MLLIIEWCFSVSFFPRRFIFLSVAEDEDEANERYNILSFKILDIFKGVKINRPHTFSFALGVLCTAPTKFFETTEKKKFSNAKNHRNINQMNSKFSFRFRFDSFKKIWLMPRCTLVILVYYSQCKRETIWYI